MVTVAQPAVTVSGPVRRETDLGDDGILAADVAVIGGGIVGCAVAYFLAEHHDVSVVVLERDTLGAGSTAHSMGGVRQQFSTALEIELSKRALEFWRSVEQRFGVACPFHRDGYLIVTSRGALFERLRTAAVEQRNADAGPIEILDAEGIAQLVPWLSVHDLVGGSWTPDDGRVNPTDGLHALVGAARRKGVTFHEGASVTGLTRRRRGWLLEGETRCHVRDVVVACGVWTPALLRTVGVQLRIDPMPLHYAFTGPCLEGQPLPLTIDLDTGLAVEREGRGLCVSLLLAHPPEGFTAADMLAQLDGVLAHRAPELRHAGVRATGSGLVELTPDGHPYAGRVDDGLWVIAGFGGHGTMHGPVLAEALADELVDQPGLDISPLAPQRTTSHAEEWMIATRKD